MNMPERASSLSSGFKKYNPAPIARSCNRSRYDWDVFYTKNGAWSSFGV